MSRSIASLDDCLALLTGDLEPFRFPVRDLAAGFGAEYEADALFVLGHLERFAAQCGDSLAASLAVYRRHLDALLAERQAARPAGADAAAAAGVARLMAEEGSQRAYLYALAWSTLLDRSRYEVWRDYRRVIAEHVRRGPVLEIGAGTCLAAALAAARAPVEAYERNGLSRIWWRLLGLEGRGELAIADYDFRHAGRYELVTMVELLEHVPDPRRYLEGAHRVLQDGGKAYLTFALRMPQFDHLYLFESIAECREMLDAAGFAVAAERCLVETYRPLAPAEAWRLAAESNRPATYCCLAHKPGRDPAAALLAEFNDALAS
jgi:SAM-dependent methyltransferase